jgi:hypothetical protein
MTLDPTHVRLKLLHACDQWHSSRESTALTGVIINHVETLKVYDQQAMQAHGNLKLQCLNGDVRCAFLEGMLHSMIHPFALLEALPSV